jgi:tRNA threonylcarbamoyl adenosine modification protein YeaZ
MTKTGPVLAFDTSGPFCAAALLRGGEVLWSDVWEGARGQAEELFPLLERGMTATGLDWADLHRIGVGIGPGNFTGIRIAVSSARGLALSLKIPAIGVSRLDALALDLPRPVTTLVGAPRGSAYVQRFHDSGADAPALLQAEALQALISAAETPFTGDVPEGTDAVPAQFPLAVAIARIAAEAPDDAPRPAPLYLRAADAAPASDPPPKILA